MPHLVSDVQEWPVEAGFVHQRITASMHLQEPDSSPACRYCAEAIWLTNTDDGIPHKEVPTYHTLSFGLVADEAERGLSRA